MTRYFAAAAFAAIGLASSANAQVVFTEDFDDGGAAGRWSAPFTDSEAANFDGTVDFAADYGALGIPAAPNSGGTTTGVLFEANRTDNPNSSGDQGESIGTIATGFSLPAGSFKMTMDVYFNVENPNSGTTEYGTFGIYASGPNFPGDDGVNDDAPFRFGLSNGDGLAWQANGDAGSTFDFLRYEDPGNADAGAQFSLYAYDDLLPGAIPGLPANATGSGAIGPQENWIEVSIERVGKIISFSINGFEIDSIIDQTGVFSSGGIMIGYSDPFNSVGVTTLPVATIPPTPGQGDSIPGFAHFMVIDNIVITDTVPEPATAMLVALGGVSTLVRRRRR